MGNTVRIKVSRLKPEHLRECPVWMWVDDFDDESLIEPVPPTNPLPDDLGDLFVKADFYTPSGRHFSGFIIVADTVYVAELEAEGEYFGFNKALKDLGEESLDELRRRIGDESAEIFPLRYETGYRLYDGTPLSGTFDPFN